MELEIARLEGMLEERSPLVSDPGSLTKSDSEWRILHFAELEAQQRTDAAKFRFFEELNREVLRLARAFGMHALETVEIDRAAHMRLVKGGASTSFSKVTDGERLRLKIAVVIALLRLGKRSGIGRHPGILLIDSPGAQEEADKDFTKEIEELTRVAGELEEVQILLASARASLVRRVLPADQMRIAPRGGKLW